MDGEYIYYILKITRVVKNIVNNNIISEFELYIENRASVRARVCMYNIHRCYIYSEVTGQDSQGNEFNLY